MERRSGRRGGCRRSGSVFFARDGSEGDLSSMQIQSDVHHIVTFSRISEIVSVTIQFATCFCENYN